MNNEDRLIKAIREEIGLDSSVDISYGEIKFLNRVHRETYNNYLQMAGVHKQDRERQAFFYIMAGSPDLVSKGIDRFYDFEGNMTRISPDPDQREEEFKKFSFCSSSRALTLLALNLYNGSSYESLTVSETFWNLDRESNYHLAINGIRIRFET